MRLKSICLAGATLVALAVPAAASADPYWEHDGWRAHEWRENQWREYEWREHEAWAPHPEWYDGPRCTIEEHVRPLRRASGARLLALIATTAPQSPLKATQAWP